MRAQEARIGGRWLQRERQDAEPESSEERKLPTSEPSASCCAWALECWLTDNDKMALAAFRAGLRRATQLEGRG